MIGIVILNYRTYDLTLKCVQSIFKYTTMDFKIYIVDNHSEDGSYEKLYAIFNGNAKVCVISSPENGGYSKGNNIGIKKAGADGVDCVLIINSDVELLNDAIGIMYNQLMSDENIAVAGPSIVSPELKEQQFARKKLDFKGYIFDKKPLFWIRKIFPKLIKNRKLEWENNNPVYSFTGMVSGCCFIIKYGIFERIGFFDENVFLFGEEDILAYKLDELRMNAAIISPSSVMHNESSAIAKKGNAFTRVQKTISAVYILKFYSGISSYYLFFVYVYSFVPLFIISIFNSTYRYNIRLQSKSIKDFLFNTNKRGNSY